MQNLTVVLFKIFNIFFCVTFVFFAALQYNDPDPYVWMPIYLYCAVMCWLGFRSRFLPRAYLAGISVFVVYAIYKIFDENGVWDWATKHHFANIADTMKAETPWVEETREFFGLMICVVVLLINYYYGKRKLRTR